MHSNAKLIILQLALFLILPRLSTEQRYEHALLDIILVVDTSGSITETDYGKMLNAIDELPTIFPIGKTKTKLAFVTFASLAVMHHNFIGDVNQFKSEVNKLRSEKPIGFTATDRAFDVVKNNVIKSDENRPTAKDVIVLITDGCTNPHGNNAATTTKDAEKAVEDIAKTLRDSGVVIFLAHVGTIERCYDHELKIVGPENPQRRREIDNFDNLTEEVFDVFAKQVVEAPPPSPCKYDPICYYADDKREKCVGGWMRQKPKANETHCVENKPKEQPKCPMLEHCKSDCNSLATDEKQCSNWCDKDIYIWCKACKRCFMRDPDSGKDGDQTGHPPETKSSAKDQTAMFVGIGVCALVLILMILVVTLLVLRRNRREKKKKELLKLKSKSEASESRSAVGKTSTKDKSIIGSRVSTHGTAGATTGPTIRSLSKGKGGDVGTSAPMEKSGRQVGMGVSLRSSERAETAKEPSKLTSRRSKSKHPSKVAGGSSALNLHKPSSKTLGKSRRTAKPGRVPHSRSIGESKTKEKRKSRTVRDARK